MQSFLDVERTFDGQPRELAALFARIDTGRGKEALFTQAPEEFRRRDIERALPEISPATVRVVLNDLRDAGRIASEGGGPSATWRRLS